MNEHDFESQLRAALARKEPPPGFAARTVDRAVAADTPRPLPATRRPTRMWLSLALAATLLVTFAAAGWQQRQRALEERRAEAAKQQLMLALRITSEKLAVIERVLDRSMN